MLPADKALMERLGARLRQLREAAGLTQEAVAERAGFGGKYLGEIEKGLRDVPLSTLRAIAENGLGVHLDKVVGAKGVPSSTRNAPPRAQPRDVELTAELIGRLPLRQRRPLLALVKEMIEKR